jgi:hypothetical protein
LVIVPDEKPVSSELDQKNNLAGARRSKCKAFAPTNTKQALTLSQLRTPADPPN